MQKSKFIVSFIHNIHLGFCVQAKKHNLNLFHHIVSNKALATNFSSISFKFQLLTKFFSVLLQFHGVCSIVFL